MIVRRRRSVIVYSTPSIVARVRRRTSEKRKVKQTQVYIEWRTVYVQCMYLFVYAKIEICI